MKKIQLILVFLACTMFAQAQFPVWCFYHQQKRGEGVTKFMVPGFLFKIGGNLVEDKNIAHLVKKMGTIRLIAAEGKENAFDNEEAQRFVKKLHRWNYEDLVSIKDGKERVHIMVRERHGKIRRYLMFVNSDTDAVMISGKCKLSVEDFMTIANAEKKEWKERKQIKVKVKM